MDTRVPVGAPVADIPISQYHLSWDSFKTNVCNGFTKLQQNEEFVDMTLAADGHLVKAHKSVLALASPYIKSLLQSTPNQHPVVFLDNVSHEILNYILTYIYTGEVSVEVDKIQPFMRVAKGLRIRGLFGSQAPKVTRKEKREEIQTNPSDQSAKDNGIANSGNSFSKRITDDSILINSISESAIANFERQNEEASLEENVTGELNENTLLSKVDFHMETDAVENEKMLTNRENRLYLTADGYEYKLELQQGYNKLANCTSNTGHGTCNSPEVSGALDNTNTAVIPSYFNIDSVGSIIANNKMVQNEIVTPSLSSVGTLDPQLFTPQYTVSNRGCLQLILNRYMYYCHHQSHGGRKRRWRCIDYKSKHCPAFIDSDCDILTARKNGHIHQFHDEKIRKKMKNIEVVTNLNILLNKINHKKKQDK